MSAARRGCCEARCDAPPSLGATHLLQLCRRLVRQTHEAAERLTEVDLACRNGKNQEKKTQPARISENSETPQPRRISQQSDAAQCHRMNEAAPGCRISLARRGARCHATFPGGCKAVVDVVIHGISRPRDHSRHHPRDRRYSSLKLHRKAEGDRQLEVEPWL